MTWRFGTNQHGLKRAQLLVVSDNTVFKELYRKIRRLVNTGSAMRSDRDLDVKVLISYTRSRKLEWHKVLRQNPEPEAGFMLAVQARRHVPRT